jgi:antitoxin MazE
VVGAPIGASGTISEDGAVDLVLSRADPVGTVRPYDAAGSVWFKVSPDAIQVRTGNQMAKLTRAHDIHISKLLVQPRNGVVHLVSTGASHFGKSKKRNSLARTQLVGSYQRENRTSNEAISVTSTDQPPLVSYVTKTGDNYVLLMSPSVLEQAGLSEGARVEIEPTADGRLVISRSKRHFTLDELLAGMTPEREHPLEDDAPRGEETL